MAASVASTSPRIGAIVPQDAPLLQIPTDPLILIFQRVNGGDINALILSCKHLYSIFENDLTWNRLLCAHFPLYDSPDINNYREAYKATYVYLKFKEALNLMIVRTQLYHELDGGSILALGLSSKCFNSCIQGDVQWYSYLSVKLQEYRLFNSMSKAFDSERGQEPTPDTNWPMGISMEEILRGMFPK